MKKIFKNPLINDYIPSTMNTIKNTFFYAVFFSINLDSFFKNAKSVTFQTMTIPNHYMWMYRDKTILYMVKLTLRLSCAMNFAIYPHDTQECKLQMESCKYLTSSISSNYIYRKLMTLHIFVPICLHSLGLGFITQCLTQLMI